MIFKEMNRPCFMGIDIGDPWEAEKVIINKGEPLLIVGNGAYTSEVKKFLMKKYECKNIYILSGLRDVDYFYIYNIKDKYIFCIDSRDLELLTYDRT